MRLNTLAVLQVDIISMVQKFKKIMIIISAGMIFANFGIIAHWLIADQ